jgi:hypothetical protein
MNSIKTKGHTIMFNLYSMSGIFMEWAKSTLQLNMIKLWHFFVSLQQQTAILRSTYHRKQQRKKFPKARIYEL